MVLRLTFFHHQAGVLQFLQSSSQNVLGFCPDGKFLVYVMSFTRCETTNTYSVMGGSSSSNSSILYKPKRTETQVWEGRFACTS